MNNIKEELFNARKLYRSQNYEEALAIFEKHFNDHPEAFHLGFKSVYAWAIFKVHVSNFKSDEELFDSAERITELVVQENLNVKRYCVYTFAVFRVLTYLKKNERYYDLPYWLDKLNPVLLDEAKSEFNGRPGQSKKEQYYEISSIAYLKMQDFEKCVEISKKALESVKSFTNFGDVWHKWRIGKSLVQMNRPAEALDYLKEVIKQKDEWYIYKEIGEIYFRLSRPLDALEYLCPAILSRNPPSVKVNLYYLVYKILDSIHSEFALMHAQLYYLLKLESGAQINWDVRKLNIDESQLNKKEIERKIIDVWTQYRFKDQKLQYGTVNKFFEDKNFGFIMNEDNKTVFFHRNEFRGRNIYAGQFVTFYTEESFDKSKNRQSVKAVNITPSD